jgi:DNA-binding CsgD family transcriptional regulator
MGPWAERDPYVASTVCHALVLAGAIDEAQRVADAALSLERHPFALSAAAAVAIAMGDTETATAHANAALEVLTNSGYRITEGHTRLTLVEAGDPDAQIHLERAALLARETGSANLADRVRRAGGEPELAPPPSSAPQPVPDSHGLSPRERELLALLAQGRTDAEIAKLLFISVATVRSHLDRVRDKTGRRRRPELTLLATQLGLV